MPARYLLDTNILSSLIKDPQGAVTKRLAQLDADAICTSIVVACELRFGASRKGSATLTQRVEQLLAALTVLPLDAPADEHYADIRAVLERNGTPIGSHDLFIAAHARSRGNVLRRPSGHLRDRRSALRRSSDGRRA